MQTWASRTFHLSAATPNVESRNKHLEHLELHLDGIEQWLGSMRRALAEARGDH